MQHPRQREVVDVDVSSRAFVGNIGPRQRLADRCVGRRRTERRFGIDLDRQPAIADQRADGDAAVARDRAHFAVHDRQLRGRTIQSRRAEREQRLPRGGGSLPDIRAATRQARTAAGPALIGTQAGVTVDDGDAAGRNAELLGGHLRDGDPQPGPDVDLAGVDGDGAVGVKRQKTIDLDGIQRLAVVGAGGRRRLRVCAPRPRRQRRFEREAHDQGSAGLQDGSA